MNSHNTPLHADGLSRRVYPFLGIAIVGLVSAHGFTAVVTSLPLSIAFLLGVGLVIIPLARIDTAPRNGVVAAIPVVAGFVLAMYPLWLGATPVAVGIAFPITVLGSSLVLLPWDRIPRYLHAVPPIVGLAVAFGLEVQFEIGRAHV